MSSFEEDLRQALSQVSEQSADPLDYSGDVNPSSWSTDPRVLNDLRNLARLEGISNYTDDELVEWYKARQRWQGTNAGSAALAYAQTVNAPKNKQVIESRLQRVWNSVPNFWEQGGGGTADALGDYIPAAILDPTNLISGAGAAAKAGKAARAAYVAGKTVEEATSAGFKAGVKTGIMEEAGINAFQSAAVDLAQQGREQNLGMRDEISLGQTAISAGTDALVGGIAGGIMGAPGAYMKAKGAANQAGDLVSRGLTRADIGTLAPEKLNELSAMPRETSTLSGDAEWDRMFGPTVTPNDLSGFSPEKKLAAENAAAMALQKQQQAAKTASDARSSPDLTIQFEAALAGLERADQAYQARRQQMMFDGLHERAPGDPGREAFDQLERDHQEVARARSVLDQQKNAATEIVALEQSNTPQAAQTAAERRNQLQRTLAFVNNAALRFTTPEAADAYVAQRMEARAAAAQAEAEAAAAKPAKKEAAPAPAPAPGASAAPAAGAAPAPGASAAPAAEPAAAAAPPKAIGRGIAAKLPEYGLTAEDVHAYVATGQSKANDPTKPYYTEAVLKEAKAWKEAGSPKTEASAAPQTEAPAATTAKTDPDTAIPMPDQSGTTPGIWANKDNDIPVHIVNEPAHVAPDGSKYRKVIYEGKETFVPEAELKPLKPAEAAPAAPQAAAAPVRKPAGKKLQEKMAQLGVSEQEVNDFIASGKATDFDPASPNLSRKVIEQAAEAKKAGGIETPPPVGEKLRTASDDYSARAREEFMDILGVMSKVDYLDNEDDVRQLFEVLSQSPKYQTDRADLQALFDHWGKLAEQSNDGGVSANISEGPIGRDPQVREQLKAKGYLDSEIDDMTPRHIRQLLADTGETSTTPVSGPTVRMPENTGWKLTDDLRQQLRDKGWSDTQIDEAKPSVLRQALDTEAPAPKPAPTEAEVKLNPDAPFTATEMKFARRVVKLALKNGLEEEDAKMLALDRIMARRAIKDPPPPTDLSPEIITSVNDAAREVGNTAGNPARDQSRSTRRQTTGAATERASIFTTAGRQMNGRKFVEFMMRGTPTGTIPREMVEEIWRPLDPTKGYVDRSIIGRGLGTGENRNIYSGDFNRSEAKQFADGNKKIIDGRRELVQKFDAAYSRFNNNVFEELSKNPVVGIEGLDRAQIATIKRDLELKGYDPENAAYEAQVRAAKTSKGATNFDPKAVAMEREAITRKAKALWEDVRRNYDPKNKIAKTRIKKVKSGDQTMEWEVIDLIPKEKRAEIAARHGVSEDLVNSAIRAAAAERRAFEPVGSTIAAYKTMGSETVYTPSGRTKVDKGVTVFYNARDGKSYSTMQQAIWAQGANADLQPSDKLAILKSALDVARRSGNPDAVRDVIEAIARGGTGMQQTPAGVRTVSGQTAYVMAVRKSQLASGDPNFDVRKLHDGNKDAGIEVMLGNSRPDEWEYRYTTDPYAGSSLDALHKIWNAAPPIRKVSEVEQTFGDAATKQALPFNKYREMKVDTITDAEANAISEGLLYNGDTRSSADIKAAAANGEMTMDTVVSALNGLLYNAEMPKNAADFERQIAAMETLHALQQRKAPNGYTLPNAAREASVASVHELLSGYDAQTIATARSIVANLGGDQKLGPIFGKINEGLVRDTGMTGNYGFDPRSNRQTVSLASRDSIDNLNRQLKAKMAAAGKDPTAAFGSAHPVAMLLHELGHWAFRNILNPSDRVELFKAIRRNAYDEAGNLRADFLKENLPGFSNASSHPQEIIANLFSMWAMRNRADIGVNTPDSWLSNMSDIWKVFDTLKKAVVSMIDRYYFRKPIMPEMEPYFAKILPESERFLFENGRGKPPESFGPKAKLASKINERYRALRLVSTDMAVAMASGSDEAVLQAAQNVRDFFRSIAVNRQKSGTFGPLLPMQRMIHMRTKDLTMVLNGKLLDDAVLEKASKEIAPDSIDPNVFWDFEIDPNDPDSKLPNFAFENKATQSAAANRIRRLYKFGYAPDMDGVAEVPPWFEDGMKVEYTSLLATLERMEKELIDTHMQMSGRLPLLTSPDSITKTFKAATSPRTDARVKRQHQANERATGRIINDAIDGKTPPDGPTGESSPNASGVKQLTIQDLAAEYQRARGTERGRQITKEIVKKSRHDTGFARKDVEIPNDIRRLGNEALGGEILDIIYHGDPKMAGRLDLLEQEVYRRSINKVGAGKAAKAADMPKSKPVSSNVVEAIARELEDSDGLEVEDGIPPNARANIREMLSFLTHRDQEVAGTMRTMAYRMMNLMGKTVRSALTDANVFSLDELSRLAGVDASPSATGMTVDFRGNAFKTVRSDLRRLSVGLAKGKSDPFDVIHELSHLITRGVLPDEDRLAITELFRLSDDKVKSMIEGKYADKYKTYSTNEREARLAEEWFAESMAQYMGQRVARGDIFKAATERGVADLKLRGKVSTAIDRAVEYTAYVANGLIGRKDIRQNFRRLMIYGDMFEAPSPTPILNTFSTRYGVPAHLAADYAAESMLRNRNRLANMKLFVAGTAGEGADGNPLMLYHASPNGYALRKATSPDAVLQPSSAGEFGPGVYTTQNPVAAERIYANGRTINSMTSLIDNANLPVGVKDDLYDLVEGELTNVRTTLSKSRADLAFLKAEADKLGDAEDANAAIIKDDVSGLERQIAMLAQREKAVLDTLDRYGIKPDGVVLPLLTNAQRLADFRQNASYDVSDAFVGTLMDKLSAYYPGNRQTDSALAAFNSTSKPMSGQELYKKAVAFLGKLGSKPAEAKSIITAALKEMGYDGLRVSYMNQLEDGLSKADVIRHDGLVVFEPGSLKHIDADEFDAADERLYYRDVEGSPVSPSGELINAMVDDGDYNPSGAVFANIVEQMDTAGVAPPVVDAVASAFRNRMPDARTVTSMAKFFQNTLGTQSGSLRMVGMKTLADKVENFFTGVQTRFAKEFYPTLDMIRTLPGTDTAAGRWTKRSFGIVPGIGKKLSEQPKSYSNVVRALRYGNGSRQEISLNAHERKVYLHIRQRFQDLHKALRASGELIGFRDNYVPQIYKPEIVARDRQEFIQTLAEYFIEDRRANGLDLSMEDAKKMSERVAARITDDDADTFFPSDIQRSNTGADNLDYTRMIELEKMPGFMHRMEKFLEDDLEAIWTKYADATARRLEQNKLFGNNTHGFNDYVKVVNEGVNGIADLLSTKKIYSKSLRGLNADNEVVNGLYQLEISMPFETRPDEAMTFARGLQEIHQKSGSAAAMQALIDLLPPGSNPDEKITYMTRAKAIIDALDDFKGAPNAVQPADMDRAVKTMALVKRQPLTDAAFGGKAMLNASRSLRAFNAISLLSFTTLTSIPDLTLPIIRSGEFGAWRRAMTNMAQDPDYARLMRNVGVVVDSEVHHHMSKLFGTGMSKTMDAFFNATMLTPWTNTMRKIAAATGYETFKTMQDKAFANYRPGADIASQNAQYKLAARFLTSYGLGDYLPSGMKAKVSLADKTLLATDDTVRLGVVKFADQAIFSPNPNDVPMWSQTPVGAIIFQLKAYPLMMGRLSKWVLQEALVHNNWKPFTYMATLAPAAGATALAVKDVVQSRGGEGNDEATIRKRNALKMLGYDKKVHGDENSFLGWYLEGFMTAGGLGLIGEMIHDTATQVDNGAYGKNRIYSTVFGPSVGTFSSALDIAGGAVDALKGNDSNSKERAAVREVVRRVPILGGMGSVREGVTNYVAGEKSTGGKDWADW